MCQLCVTVLLQSAIYFSSCHAKITVLQRLIVEWDTSQIRCVLPLNITLTLTNLFKTKRITWPNSSCRRCIIVSSDWKLVKNGWKTLLKITMKWSFASIMLPSCKLLAMRLKTALSLTDLLCSLLRKTNSKLDQLSVILEHTGLTDILVILFTRHYDYGIKQ